MAEEEKQETRKTAETNNTKRRVHNRKREAQVDTANLPPNTVYNGLVSVTQDFSRKDLRKISNTIREKYYEALQKRGLEIVNPETIEQEENGVKYQVYCYPEYMRKEIKKISIWFFNTKKERAEKHKRTVAKEQLERLKKENSPDYEMALVRYNMAEEERRKKEKEKQAVKPNNKKNVNQRQVGRNSAKSVNFRKRSYITTTSETNNEKK